MAWLHTENGKFTSTKTTSNEQIKESKGLHGKQKQRWHDVVNADLKFRYGFNMENKSLKQEPLAKLHDLNHFKETEEKGKKDRKKENEKSETDLKCPTCNKICLNKTGLANHIRLSHTTNFQKTSKCQFCGKYFKKQGMPNHVKKCQKTQYLSASA